MIRMKRAHLEDGTVLGKDLMDENRILMEKGRPLNTRVYLKNEYYREMLLALKKQDYYSSMGAIDVFTLGVLAAKKEYIQNLEHYAPDFLFHDLDKLKTPLKVLNKEGKLSKQEFDKMKEHTEVCYQFLCDLNLESMAYLAKLHHERIDKRLSSHIETPKCLFSEYLNYLINVELDQLEKYYQKLKAQYSPFECFTKIYIPIYKMFNVMKESEIVDAIRLKEVSEKLITLLNDEMVHLRKDSQKNETMILLVEKANRASGYVQLIEGIFHTKGIYPFLLDMDLNEKELVEIANYCDASAICVIGEKFEPVQCKDRQLEQFYINNHKLEHFVNSFAGKAYREVDMKQKLKKYKGSSPKQILDLKESN